MAQPRALHLLRLSEGGGAAILPRLTAADRITSKQWLCAFVVPLSTTTAPKQHRIRIRTSLTSSPSPSVSPPSLSSSVYASTPIRSCCSSRSRPLLRIALSPKPISIPAPLLAGRIELLLRAASCSSPPASFESSPQHSARQISGCSEALAACYGRQFRRNHYATSALCSSLKSLKLLLLLVWRIARKLRPGASRSATPLRATVCTPSHRAPSSRACFLGISAPAVANRAYPVRVDDLRLGKDWLAVDSTIGRYLSVSRLLSRFGNPFPIHVTI